MFVGRYPIRHRRVFLWSVLPGEDPLDGRHRRIPRYSPLFTLFLELLFVLGLPVIYSVHLHDKLLRLFPFPPSLLNIDSHRSVVTFYRPSLSSVLYCLNLKLSFTFASVGLLSRLI